MPFRNRPALRAQVLSLAWPALPAHLATSVSSQNVALLPLCPPTGRASSQCPAFCCWLLGPQPSSRGQSQASSPVSGPAQGGTPSLPLLPLRLRLWVNKRAVPSSQSGLRICTARVRPQPQWGYCCSRMCSGSMTAIRKEMKGKSQDAIICMGIDVILTLKLPELGVAGSHQRPAASNHMQISRWSPFPCFISRRPTRWVQLLMETHCLLWSLVWG